MIPGVDPDSVVALIWGLALLAMAWTWAPATIASLGGTRYSSGETPNSDGPLPAKDYQFWADQLIALGFEPLGAGWMRIDFAGQDWSLYSPVQAFRNTAHQCFAYMSKAPAPYYFWPGAAFLTCFADGSALHTNNNSELGPNPDGEFCEQGVVSLSLAEVAAYHWATQELFQRSGRKLDTDLSMDNLLRTTDRFFGPKAKQEHGRAGTQYLFAHGLIHISASTPAAYLAGLTHWSVPIVNLVLACVLSFGESMQKRQYAAAVRAGLRAKAAQGVERREAASGNDYPANT